MMKSIKSPFRTVIGVIAILVALDACFAAKMPSYDMASLAYQADYIVSTTTPAAPPNSKNNVPVPAKVTINKVFKGDLPIKSQQIVLNYEIPKEAGFRPADIGRFEEAVLFLRKEKDGFSVILSGVRVISSKGICRLVQFNNPGGYELSPYSLEFIPEPQDGPAWNDFAAQKKLFWDDLNAAIERARLFETAEKSKDLKTLRFFIYPRDGSNGYDNYLGQIASRVVQQQVQ